jgi:PAS domain S-box-containing protein
MSKTNRDQKGLKAELAQARARVAELERRLKDVSGIEEQGAQTMNSTLSTEEFRAILDIDAIQAMMEDFHRITGFLVALLDTAGVVHVAVGWQDICTKFHRVNPDTAANCLKSDTVLGQDIKPGQFSLYKCRNHLWDMASPVMVGDRHAGNIFFGQFMLEDEEPDRDFFRSQARRYGFDESAYLDALDRVPRLSRDRVDAVMSFYVKLAEMLAESGVARWKLTQTVSHLNEVRLRLQQSEQRYKALFAAVSDPVLVADRKTGIIVECNKAAVNYFGRSREQIIGSPQHELHPPQTPMKHGVTEDFKRHVTDPNHSEEVWLLAAGGEPRLAEVSAVTFEIGESCLILGLFRDITERKKAEEALKASEQQFRGLLENVDMVAVQGYDVERKVIFWNAASERLYGYSAEEALGRKLEDLIIPEPMRAEVVGLVTDWIENGNVIPPGELELQRKDGSLVPVHSSHVKQEDSQGNWAMYCIDVELTDIKKAHDQLLKAKEEAEAANKAKSEFLANMSHEIRTPMNGIIGMLQLLQTTELDNEQKEYSLMALQSSNRLTRLLADILDLSRVEASRLEIRSEPFDLSEVLDQCMELFTPTTKQSDVLLNVDIHPDVQRRVVGDPARLQQLLFNIIGNALKFTHSGQILVAASPLPAMEKEQARVLFSISDTGIGISDDTLDTLFTPFTQGSQGYTRTHQGAGLGLSICKRLIELMGGNISVESELGKGTTVHFTITFLRDATPSSTGEFAEVGTRLMGTTGKILLAEDDRISTMTAVKQMGKMGFEVTSVENGRQVLETLRKESFDLILMDVQMPVIDGVETTRMIRAGDAGEKNNGIPIVAMTAYAMEGDRDKFLAAGMNDYLAKPVDMDELEQTIERMMGKE